MRNFFVSFFFLLGAVPSLAIGIRATNEATEEILLPVAPSISIEVNPDGVYCMDFGQVMALVDNVAEGQEEQVELRDAGGVSELVTLQSGELEIHDGQYCFWNAETDRQECAQPSDEDCGSGGTQEASFCWCCLGC